MSKLNVRFLAGMSCLVLFACSDSGRDLTAPSELATPLAQSQGQGNGKTSLDLIEDDYNDGLLEKNNANLYREYAVSDPSRLPPKYQSSEKGKDATYSMVRMALEWEELSVATRKEILDLRANGFGNLKESVVTAHFVLHFTTQGKWAVPAQDSDGNGVSDFIDVAAESWETVWSTEIENLGYPSPKGTPAQKFHVYYKDMPFYGYAVPENVELLATSPVAYGTASAWIAVENDFAGFIRNDEDVTGLETIRSGALKVTQAHEFMHASQFNINVYQSGWLFESHATWAEDMVYDGINDWRWYINRFLINPDAPIFNRYVYGSAFFMHYLSETYGTDVTRQIWNASRTNSTPNAVRVAAFGGSWEKMKAFAPAEYLLKVSDFTTDPASVIPTPRNTIRATHSSYPVSVDVAASDRKTSNRAPWGLGANFVDFTPSGSGDLTITFNGADGFAWRAFVVATATGKKSSASVLPIVLDAGSAGTITVAGFGTRYSKITLVPTIADRPGVEVPYAYSATIE